MDDELKNELRKAIRSVVEDIRGGGTPRELGIDPASAQLISQLDDAAVESLVEVYAMLGQILGDTPGEDVMQRLTALFRTTGSAESVYATMSEAQWLLPPQQPPDPNADGARLFYTRGQRAFKSERYADAKKLFKRALEISPEYKDAWNALASTYEQLGDKQAADEAFSRACEL